MNLYYEFENEYKKCLSKNGSVYKFQVKSTKESTNHKRGEIQVKSSFEFPDMSHCFIDKCLDI